MSDRQYFILGISITKVCSILTVGVLEQILVTAKQFFRSWQKIIRKKFKFQIILKQPSKFQKHLGLSQSLLLIYNLISLYMQFSNALDQSAVDAGQSGPTSFMVERREKVLPSAA